MIAMVYVLGVFLVGIPAFSTSSSLFTGCSHVLYFWIERGNENRHSSFAFQHKANLVLHTPFVINGLVIQENNTVNQVLRDGVADLLDTQKQHDPTDFISRC